MQPHWGKSEETKEIRDNPEKRSSDPIQRLFLGERRDQVKAFFFGGTIVLRYRRKGLGNEGRGKYLERVEEVGDKKEPEGEGRERVVVVKGCEKEKKEGPGVGIFFRDGEG